MSNLQILVWFAEQGIFPGDDHLFLEPTFVAANKHAAVTIAAISVPNAEANVMFCDDSFDWQPNHGFPSGRVDQYNCPVALRGSRQTDSSV